MSICTSTAVHAHHVTTAENTPFFKLESVQFWSYGRSNIIEFGYPLIETVPHLLSLAELHDFPELVQS